MKRTLQIVCGLLLMASCAPVYVPNVRNTPLFTKAGEFQTTMMYGSGGLDLQAAVAVTNNFALMGNYSYENTNNNNSNNNNNSTNSADYHRHMYYEGAMGYYRNENGLCFEIFTGYGKGSASSYGNYSIFNSTNNLSVTGDYHRFFIQPSFGFNRKVIHVGFTPRFSWVNFDSFTAVNSTTSVTMSPSVFFEPAVTAKFNFMDNRFFGTVQLGFSTPINGSTAYDYEGVIFSTGLGIRLGGLHWNVKEKEIAP